LPSQAPIDPLFADILRWAKGIALAEGAKELDASHVLLGAFKSAGGRDLLKTLLPTSVPLEETLDPAVRSRLAAVNEPVAEPFGLSPRMKRIRDEVWGRHGALPAEAVLRSILDSLRAEEEWVRALLESAEGSAGAAPAERVRALLGFLDDTHILRRALSERLAGQNRAIEMVCDAYFSTRLFEKAGARDPVTGRGPRMILTFVGPPGVGKTYMAEILAHHLREGEAAELLRLDMTAYAGHQAHEQLVGFSTSYKGATEGLLTGFARAHPEGFILVDEVEKAHPNTQDLFLQVLDSGGLYDNHVRETIDFSRNVTIFTTNLGRSLYDAPERSGVLRDSEHLADAVLQALREEVGREHEGRTGLSAELLSRLAKGHVALFNRLDGLALERIAGMTVRKFSGELEASIGLPLAIDDPIVLVLFVLRFGAGGDARRLTTGVRNYLYGAVKQLLHEHRGELLEGEKPVLPKVRAIRIALGRSAVIPARITEAMERKSRVLLIDDDEWDLSNETDFHWSRADGREEADALLRKGDIDLVLLDLHIGAGPTEKTSEKGMLLLRWIRSRSPTTPVYLFSESPEKRGLSAEALLRVSAEGGAAGVLPKLFLGDAVEEMLARDGFFSRLREVDAGVKRQKLVEQYRNRLKVIEFDAERAPSLDAEGRVVFEVGGIREATSIAPEDRDLPGWVDLPRERFSDIAGAENAKQRLAEVVRWLGDPRPVIDIGVDLPKGILLTGPPGTGKTSLARATAGEAEVPFFAISGASVFRKYVGESEATIRNLFAAARRYAPSILFIDEIDAIGGERSGTSVDNAARVGVLNELLAQMDGFVQTGRPVFVMAATNRADILDPALVRSGRFDLSVEVPIPNASAREEIFRVHLRRVAAEDGVDVAALAARTAGLSGADIMQICKEAAFLALREGAKRIGPRHLDEAITTVRFGLSSERVLLDDASKWSTAVHEAGHAIAQHAIFPDEPVSQISILPRGRALGFTEHVPARHYVDQSRKRLRGMLRVLLAGRAAEKMVLGEDGLTSGCSEDLERASALALRMVVAWGMDDRLGPLSLSGLKQGLSVAEGMPVESAALDEAVAASRKILEEEEDAARSLLEENKERLLRLAEAVRKKETLGSAELGALLERKAEKEI